MEEITAKLVLTQEEIAYIWHGGMLAVKIDAPDLKVSLESLHPAGTVMAGARMSVLSVCRQNGNLLEVRRRHGPPALV